MLPPPPSTDENDGAPSPSWSRVPARTGDNGNYDITPVAGVNAVVKNSHNVENTSATLDYSVPVVDFDRGDDGDAATGGQYGVSHAKRTKLASKSGLGSEAKGWEGGTGR